MATDVTRGLLLDTCAIIWIALDQMIAKDARHALNAEFAAGVQVRVSVISAWELGLLCAKGRLPTTVPALSLFNEMLDTPGVKLEALSPELLIESSFLPGAIHSDPADRILIATARHHDLAIVTRDRAILAYGAAGHVRTIAC